LLIAGVIVVVGLVALAAVAAVVASATQASSAGSRRRAVDDGGYYYNGAVAESDVTAIASGESVAATRRSAWTTRRLPGSNSSFVERSFNRWTRATTKRAPFTTG
jgi:hypothetical protein